MIPARWWSPSGALTAATGTFTASRRPSGSVGTAPLGHRSALCGATAGYWVIDPNGRVGVILRRHAKHAPSSPRRDARRNPQLLVSDQRSENEGPDDGRQPFENEHPSPAGGGNEVAGNWLTAT